jgi:hypothetical protein
MVSSVMLRRVALRNIPEDTILLIEVQGGEMSI